MKGECCITERNLEYATTTSAGEGVKLDSGALAPAGSTADKMGDINAAPVLHGLNYILTELIRYVDQRA